MALVGLDMGLWNNWFGFDVFLFSLFLILIMLTSYCSSVTLL